MIDGSVAPGFESIRDIFAENFEHRNELGAAMCVYLKGVKVVDLWGGHLDLEKTRPWGQDSRVMVFSVTKAMCALLAGIWVTKGLIEYETAISTVWPEFAQNGKNDITLRQLLEHRAGLYAIDEKITPELLMDKEKLSEVLAKQKPQDIGKAAYHAQTSGWYLSEICHRIDPQKRYLNQYLQEEVIIPEGLNFTIGLSPKDSMSDVATLHSNSAMEVLFSETNISLSLILQLINPYSTASKALKNPYFSRPSEMILPPWPYCEIPASNGIGTVRSVACLWQIALDKHFLGTQLSPDVINCLRSDPIERNDGVLGHTMRYHYGFTRPGQNLDFGASHQCLGFAGIGGSFSFAEPKYGLTYAYSPSRLGPVMWNDPRERALRLGLMDTLKKLNIQPAP